MLGLHDVVFVELVVHLVDNAGRERTELGGHVHTWVKIERLLHFLHLCIDVSVHYQVRKVLVCAAKAARKVVKVVLHLHSASLLEHL